MTLVDQVARARAHFVAELRAGSRAPGADIGIKEAAATLKTSPTPVREALERLVGEGAVIARGGRRGFAVPRLVPRDLANLYDFVGLLVVEALQRTPLGNVGAINKPTVPFDVDPSADPVMATELVIGGLIDRVANPVFWATAHRLNLILAPYRRLEPAIVPDWIVGLEALRLTAGTPEAIAATRDFTEVRVRHSARVVDAVDAVHDAADRFAI